MSLKIDILDNHPDQVKQYLTDYNSGVELQDIMEVNLALDGLLTLIFSPDKNLRTISCVILAQIANVQPGFLKRSLQVLMHRYKGADEVKSEYASAALGHLTETPIKQLITDPDILSRIIAEHIERKSEKEVEDEQKSEFLEKVATKEIKFMGISGEFLRMGRYYNKLIIDEDTEGARQVVEEIIKKTIEAYGTEDKNETFEMGSATILILANKENREPFIDGLVDKLVRNYTEGKKKFKDAYKELILYTLRSIQDLLPVKVRNEFISESNKRRTEKQQEQAEKLKLIQEAQRLNVNVELTWEKPVKELAISYNSSLKITDEKEKAKEQNKIIENVKSFVFIKDPYIKKSAINLFWQIFSKNFILVKDFTQKLLTDYKKPENAIILEENIPLLDKMGVLPKGIKSYLILDKEKRAEEERKQKDKLNKEFERIEKLKVSFSAAWDKRLVELIDNINKSLINEKAKDAEKLILGKMKNYIYAEDKEIAKQALTFLNNVARKYPNIIQKIMTEIFDLYKSEHEDRTIAVDFLGLLKDQDAKVKSVLFKDHGIEEFGNKLKEELDKREKDVQQQQLQTKWDAIKLDITTIVIDLDDDKKLQKICRAYNEAIKKKEKKQVIANVQLIINWFLGEKNEDKLDQIIKVIGKIAKQNIELIAPAIQMLLKMVDGENDDKKFKAIKGLGEVAFQRPGWAYQALDKLVDIISSEKNENARMKALVELGRIGKNNPTMLMEHLDPIINALRDPNKHVRRLAAWTIGSMAEAIPLEAQGALPALREALHDDYFLVRQFADKALKLIRAAMRK